MKFLLVALNAKYIHSNPALHSLYAYAGEKYQDSIELAEYTINNESGTILADFIKGSRMWWAFPAIYGTGILFQIS